jgi:hypothetical protein
MSAEDALSPALIGQRPPLVPMRVVCGSPGRVDVPVMLVVHVRMGMLHRLMRMLVLVVLGVRCSQTPTTIWRPAVTIAPRRAHSCNEAGDRLTPGVASDSGSDFVGHSRIPSEECTACIGHIESVRPPFGANGYLRSSQVVQGRLLPLGVTVGVAIAYFLAVRLGLALLSEGVAVFWPAAGIAVGVLVTLGRRARAAVVIGVVAPPSRPKVFGRRYSRASAMLARLF